MTHDETPRNTVRVVIRQDVETGDYTYHRVDNEHSDPYAFDIATGLFDAWEHARATQEGIWDNLAAMYGARRDTLEAARKTTRVRAQYEEAKAAWEAHCAETGETA